MKKVLKITGKVLLGLLILIVLLLVIMTVYNQIMLRKNKDLYETPLGQLSAESCYLHKQGIKSNRRFETYGL